MSNNGIKLGDILESLNNKADRDFNNLTENQKKKKNKVMMLPDYSLGVTIATNFVAPSNGYLYVRRSQAKKPAFLYVNGIEVASNMSNTSSEGGGLYAFCCKGDTITFTGSIDKSIFFPLKEVPMYDDA